MKTTLIGRLKEARKAASTTQKTLGDTVGANQAAIRRIETGRVAQTTRLFDIVRALGVKPGWLPLGTGVMRADGGDDKRPSYTNHDVLRVDILNLAVSAGPGIVNQESVETLHPVEYTPAEVRHIFDGRKAENIRIINVRGDSISGTIEPDDLLLVDISVKSFDDDGIYAFLYDGTAHIKRLRRMKDKLLVISDNRSYAAWDPIEKDEINQVFAFDKMIGSTPQTYRKYG